MGLTKPALVAFLAVVVQLLGQLAGQDAADIAQIIGNALIALLVLFGYVSVEKLAVENAKLKAAMVKAKLIKE